MCDKIIKKCEICGKLFAANKYVGTRQKTCGREECQRIYKNDYNKKWREMNPDYYKSSSCIQMIEKF